MEKEDKQSTKGGRIPEAYVQCGKSKLWPHATCKSKRLVCAWQCCRLWRVERGYEPVFPLWKWDSKKLVTLFQINFSFIFLKNILLLHDLSLRIWFPVYLVFFNRVNGRNMGSDQAQESGGFEDTSFIDGEKKLTNSTNFFSPNIAIWRSALPISGCTCSHAFRTGDATLHSWVYEYNSHASYRDMEHLSASNSKQLTYLTYNP